MKLLPAIAAALLVLVARPGASQVCPPPGCQLLCPPQGLDDQDCYQTPAP